MQCGGIPLQGNAAGLATAVHHVGLARGALIGTSAQNERIGQAQDLLERVEAMLRHVERDNAAALDATEWEGYRSINSVGYGTPEAGPPPNQPLSPGFNSNSLSFSPQFFSTPIRRPQPAPPGSEISDATYSPQGFGYQTPSPVQIRSYASNPSYPPQGLGAGIPPYQGGQPSRARTSPSPRPPPNQVAIYQNQSGNHGRPASSPPSPSLDREGSTLIEDDVLSCPYCMAELDASISVNLLQNDSNNYSGDTIADMNIRVTIHNAVANGCNRLDQLICPNCRQIVEVRVQVRHDDSAGFNAYRFRLDLLRMENPNGSPAHSLD